MIDSITSIVGCDGVGSGSDIWCLSELCVFPHSITSSAVVIAVAESIVESSLHVKLIPTWTGKILERVHTDLASHELL